MKLPAMLLAIAASIALPACSNEAADAPASDPAARVLAQTVAPDYAVRAQVVPSELPGIAAAGYRTVINNRPDGEEPGQPTSAQMAAEAARLGLEYHYIPVAKTGPTSADAQSLASVLKTAKGPVMAFCRSGKRARAIRTMVGGL